MSKKARVVDSASKGSEWDGRLDNVACRDPGRHAGIGNAPTFGAGMAAVGFDGSNALAHLDTRTAEQGRRQDAAYRQQIELDGRRLAEQERVSLLAELPRLARAVKFSLFEREREFARRRLTAIRERLGQLSNL